MMFLPAFRLATFLATGLAARFAAAIRPPGFFIV